MNVVYINTLWAFLFIIAIPTLGRLGTCSLDEVLVLSQTSSFDVLASQV